MIRRPPRSTIFPYAPLFGSKIGCEPIGCVRRSARIPVDKPPLASIGADGRQRGLVYGDASGAPHATYRLAPDFRSEERRVWEDGGSRWSPDHLKKKTSSR